MTFMQGIEIAVAAILLVPPIGILLGLYVEWWMKRFERWQHRRHTAAIMREIKRQGQS